MSGWIDAGGLTSFRQVAIDVAGARALAIPADIRSDQIVIASRVAAALRHDAAATHVRLYSVDE